MKSSFYWPYRNNKISLGNFRRGKIHDGFTKQVIQSTRSVQKRPTSDFLKALSISLFVIQCFLRVLKASLARFIAFFALIRHARLLIPPRPLRRIYASL